LTKCKTYFTFGRLNVKYNYAKKGFLDCRGWDDLRWVDLGGLWEHLVLDELRSTIDKDRIHYWRDKSAREIDFILQISRDKIDVIECKLNPDKIDISAIKGFENYILKVIIIAYHRS